MRPVAEPGVTTGATSDPARVAAIEHAKQVWTSQLVDLSGKNTLLYYRDLQVGTLNLGPHRD